MPMDLRIPITFTDGWHILGTPYLIVSACLSLSLPPYSPRRRPYQTWTVDGGRKTEDGG